MFTFIKKATRSAIPFWMQQTTINNQPLIFYFHAIGNVHPHMPLLYNTQSIENFVSLIEELLKRFKPLADLSLESIKNAGSDQFIITFDDGLISAYELAAPILEKKGIPAIFFLNPAFLERKKSFYKFEASIICNEFEHKNNSYLEKVNQLLFERGYSSNDVKQSVLDIQYEDKDLLIKLADILEIDMQDYFDQHPNFMDIEQAKDLQKRGFWLGSHSLDHPKYSEINHDQQVRQTIDSTKYMQKEFNINYRYFAFPFNDKGVDERFYKETKDVVDLFFTTNGWKRADKFRNIYSRTSLDNSSSVMKTLQANWRPLKWTI